MNQQALRRRNQGRQQDQQPRVGVPNVNAQNQEDNQGRVDPNGTIKPTLLNKIKEFVFCFVSSLYPSWDMNLYIEKNVVQEVEQPVNPQDENELNENKRNEENNTDNLEIIENKESLGEESQLQEVENQESRPPKEIEVE